MATYLPPDRRFELVDVGAGAGMLGAFLQRERSLATYRFVEPMPALQQHLESIYGAGSNVSEASYQGAEYITLLDVLEHQEDDHSFMRELVSKLDVGATLLVTVPALPALWSGWDVALGHHRRYVKRSFTDCIEGLPVVTAELTYLFPEMLLFSLVRKWRMPAQRGQDLVESAAFPDLSGPVNEILYQVGRGSVRFRRIWPAGTSLFAVLRRI